jgi:hypothetical protein
MKYITGSLINLVKEVVEAARNCALHTDYREGDGGGGGILRYPLWVNNHETLFFKYCVMYVYSTVIHSTVLLFCIVLGKEGKRYCSAVAHKNLVLFRFRKISMFLISRSGPRFRSCEDELNISEAGSAVLVGIFLSDLSDKCL